jgi:hypothetical protein
MYFDSKTYKPPPSEDTGGKALLDNWEASLLKVGDIDTVSPSIPLSSALTPQVESFCQHFNNIRLPSRLSKGANYHLFKKGIRPVSGVLKTSRYDADYTDVGRPCQRQRMFRHTTLNR